MTWYWWLILAEYVAVVLHSTKSMVRDPENAGTAGIVCFGWSLLWPVWMPVEIVWNLIEGIFKD